MWRCHIYNDCWWEVNRQGRKQQRVTWRRRNRTQKELNAKTPGRKAAKTERIRSCLDCLASLRPRVFALNDSGDVANSPDADGYPAIDHNHLAGHPRDRKSTR